MQCAATTRAGSQCKNQAVSGTQYCGRHASVAGTSPDAPPPQSANTNTPTTEADGSPAAADLPLINRYHAAWVEHGTRVAQRQHCVQIYLASVAGLFVLYAAANGKQPGAAPYLFVGVSFLTSATASLVYMHLRVMQRLCEFMRRCEKHAEQDIRQQASGTEELFYFYDPKTQNVRKFHGRQRMLHRVVLMFLLLGLEIAALAITWQHVNEIVRFAVSIAVAVIVLWSLFSGLILDKKDP